MARAASGLLKLVQSKKVLVCCGSGGVGKTTTSAALAVMGALEGKKTIVITIDPAKRLATSLGLKHESSDPIELTNNLNESLVALGQKPCQGSLHALIPNTLQTFEQLLLNLAGGDRQNMAHRVFHTSIFKIFTQEFSGTNEYMAMEKLYEIYSLHNYDLIILDTPPSANTRLFLEAPERFASFFDDTIYKWVVNPGSKIVALGVRKVLEILERLTGRGFVSEMLEFTAALFDLRNEFLVNLKAVDTLLHSKDVSFLLVTTPERLSKTDTKDFLSILERRGFDLGGFVVNRCLDSILRTETAPGAVSSDEAAVLEECNQRVRHWLNHEKDAVHFLKENVRAQQEVQMVPEQKRDVYSIPALIQLGHDLSQGAAP